MHKNLPCMFLTCLLQGAEIFLKKLTSSQLVKKFPTFYGTRRFVTTSHMPTTCPYSEPARSSPYHHIPLPEDPCYPPIFTWVFQVVSFPQVSPPKPCIHLFSPLYVLCAPPQLILLAFITQTILGEEYRSLSYSLRSSSTPLLSCPS